MTGTSSCRARSLAISGWCCSTAVHGAPIATRSSGDSSGPGTVSLTSGPGSSRSRSNDEATTADLIARHGLEFPVGHSADAHAVAKATGAFIHDDPLFLQSTGFVLNPGGQVVVSVYSSGAIGRLVPEDVIGLISYLRQHAA